MTSCSSPDLRLQGGTDESVWVFAYGSLMWRPEFPFAEAIPARLSGWHRAMCIQSTQYRGTPDRPGLVLGLDRGGSCLGLAFRILGDAWPQVREALHAREIPIPVYHPRFLSIRLKNNGQSALSAYAFVADRNHSHYWRGDEGQAVEMIREGHGIMGSCRDYLADTVSHLAGLGLADGGLKRLLGMVDRKSNLP